mmetsp:Transcript_18572/g.25439  ORF Transcript_18572/g.25439 Transcript_18572/m.25439 type:complete len:101 (-) Transcript_18572:15-317(-)
MGFLIKRAREEMSKDREREARVRGFAMPIAATYKGVDRPAGREVEGMDGWVDMSRDGNARKDGEDEEEEEDEEEGEEAEEGSEDKKPKDGKGKGKKDKGK